MKSALTKILAMCVVSGILSVPAVESRRISLKVDVKSMSGQQSIETGTQPDSTTVLKDEQARAAVSFYGYDKPFSASKESVFMTNSLAKDTITAVDAVIEYSTMAGKLLHKRAIRYEQEVAPGESTRLLFDTWDGTHTFYYFRNPPARKQNLTPYQVKILPLEVILKQ